jgi:hypothetical protein
MRAELIKVMGRVAITQFIYLAITHLPRSKCSINRTI